MRALDPLCGAVYHHGGLGVRNIDGEVTVRLEVHARRDIRAERGENLGGIETARTVSRVNHYAHARKGLIGLIGAYALADKRAQVRGVLLHMVAGRYLRGDIAELDILGLFEYISDIRRVEAAVNGKEFQSVSVARVVARGHLHGAVAGQVEHRHKHSGSGA